MFKFICYFPAETPLFITIKIEDDWVMDLSKAIAADLHLRGRKDINVDELRLFKVG